MLGCWAWMVRSFLTRSRSTAFSPPTPSRNTSRASTPQPSKSVTVFARIATAVYRGRPDLSLLIGLMPQFNAAFDLENRKKDLTPRSPDTEKGFDPAKP